MKPEKNIRVLVVEDDYLVNEMIQGRLEELGYTILDQARNGEQAFEKTKALAPDVILMDIDMPGTDGISAASQIHQECPTPIVILTAYESPELVEKASAVGVGAYLIKPPNSREMERAITIAMARFRDLMELKELNAKLQSYNEELDAFAHTVAHDLQNPLNIITGFADLLQEDYERLSPEEIKLYLEAITKNSHKMNIIIEELLLLAGVRKLSVPLKPLDLPSIIHEALERLKQMIKPEAAEIHLPERWPQALGHAPWIEEVWVNYLSNGIKYGGRPPRLELGGEAVEGNMIRYWIKDNGPGIALSDQQYLFLPFTQLSRTGADGHGLGLSIVQRIIEKLGGEVGVESRPGEGSLFWFTLPQA